MTDELKQWEYDKGYTKGYSDGRASLVEELERVKAEIQEEYKANINNDIVSFAKVLNILDKHISELKGEQDV